MVEAKPRYYRGVKEVHTILTDEAANEMLRGGWELLKMEVMDGSEGPITVYVVGKAEAPGVISALPTMVGATEGYGKGTCKYCQQPILWKDRKPYNPDYPNLSAHKCGGPR